MRLLRVWIRSRVIGPLPMAKRTLRSEKNIMVTVDLFRTNRSTSTGPFRPPFRRPVSRVLVNRRACPPQWHRGRRGFAQPRSPQRYRLYRGGAPGQCYPDRRASRFRQGRRRPQAKNSVERNRSQRTVDQMGRNLYQHLQTQPGDPDI